MANLEIVCSICGRNTPEKYQEKHHLIPGRSKETIDVCVDCGDQVHNIFQNTYLRKELDTLDKILGHEDIKRWIIFIRKKIEFGRVCMKRKKKR